MPRLLDPLQDNPTERQPLDRECKAFVEGLMEAARSVIAGRQLSIPELREILGSVRQPYVTVGPDMKSVRDQTVSLRSGEVELRIYTPHGIKQPAPALVYMHGGGWVLFSNDTHDGVMREYAERLQAVVIGVNYAQAPEAPFPVALDQVVDTIEWVVGNHLELGIDRRQVFSGGDSAGGNLAICSALQIRDVKDGDRLMPKGLILNYPVTSSVVSDQAAHLYGDASNMLSADEMVFFWDQYLPDTTKRTTPYASPLHADLSNMPPAFIAVAECDVLAEQDIAFAHAYEADQCDTTLKIYKGAPHSFIEATTRTKLSTQAFEDATNWFKAQTGS